MANYYQKYGELNEIVIEEKSYRDDTELHRNDVFTSPRISRKPVQGSLYIDNTMLFP